ncbi:hypothetical protein PISMIDRAFT_676362 [Pisolithus microcarpus 441]|uniref:Uncharacterized protein n=1 Tax=Pisolithus microcarpus 441 TaxID=765257 RepID=A0A0C9YMH5_9AGAM|nr:hypothetical protein PISMIDRAFT_676362 [Pisolithus microcarpus 441]
MSDHQRIAFAIIVRAFGARNELMTTGLFTCTKSIRITTRNISFRRDSELSSCRVCCSRNTKHSFFTRQSNDSYEAIVMQTRWSTLGRRGQVLEAVWRW